MSDDTGPRHRQQSSQLEPTKIEISPGTKKDVVPKEHGPNYYRIGVYALLSYLAVALAWLYSPKSGSHTWPEFYALCSPEGRHIYTVDPTQPWVQCIVVEGNVIVDRGPLVDIRHRRVEAKKPGLPVRFIQSGSIVVPGLSDSHAHILEYGASRLIPLEKANSAAEAVSLVKRYVASNPEVLKDSTKVIEGWGWDHTTWKDWPTAAAFNAEPLLQKRRIVLRAKDGHALWVSDAVLESLSELPESVEGGVVLRDSKGKATGVFIDNAQDLIVTPPLTELDLERQLKAAIRDAHAHGLTSIHDAALSPSSLEFFKRHAIRRQLPIRIYGMRFFEEDNYWGNTSSQAHNLGGRLTARSVKIFADGALRSGGAALYEAYSDNHHFHGVMRVAPDVLKTVVRQFFLDGWQVNVHAIGDRANGIVLDAFEAALQGLDVSTLRPRLEHAQILTQSDMARIARLGIIASIQPTHVISDMSYAEERLGAERVKGLYAFRSIINHGARITIGTDFPVESMDTMTTFYAAITRLSADGDSPHGPEGWFPDQCLTREEVLKGMTLDPAYASFSEDTLGSLEIGKIADYVVLSQDIMAIPANRILSTVVQATFMDGQPVYGSI